MRTLYIKQIKPDFDYARPYSWSQHSSFHYSKKAWYEKYVLKQQPPPSAAMVLGSTVGDKLSSDPAYLKAVPRLPVFEQKIEFTIGDLSCIGFIDSWCPETKKLYEYKTSKDPWTQKKVDDHGQLKFYVLGLYLSLGIKPEDIEVSLFSLKTHIVKGKSELVDPIVLNCFRAKITTADVLRFYREVLHTRKEMISYYELSP